MKANRIRISYLVLTLIMMTFLTACGTSEKNSDVSKEKSKSYEAGVDKNPLVTIQMENDEEITVELYPEIAPNTVTNFISLIEKGFYDGVIFHRVIPGFMIQGGDPEGTGMGGPGYSIAGEFTDNGFDNPLKHEVGVISMARTMDPNSAGSQFFIMVENVAQLDGQYAAFGKVVTGMETVKSIVSVERDAQDKPLQDQKIKKVTVDTFGVSYGEPKKVE
ncbi:peptidylprolyl isomerase [Bacillus timonensis]|nr:peptidylprolyl isomerase [Bacillus timonensis]